MTTPFISLADLSTIVGKDVSAEPLAVIAVDAASEIVRGEIGRHVNLMRGDEEALDGTGDEVLPLPRRPVIAVNSVTVDGGLLAAADYMLGFAGLLHRAYPGIWPRGVGNVVVNYDHGWAVSEADVNEPGGVYRVPSDIRRIALGIASRIYHEGGRVPGLRQESIGSYSYTIGSDLPSNAALLDSERRVLARYKAKRVAVA